jgi:hypothetical protein
MLATMTNVEELAINEIQSKTLATAICNVGRHYDAAVDPKTADWFNLAMVLGVVYHPLIKRAVSGARTRRRAKVASQETPASQGMHSDNMQYSPAGFVDGPVQVDISTMGMPQ